MSIEAEGHWSERATGGAIAVEFSGPTLECTLVRAVEGFADAHVDLHPSVVVSSRPIEVTATTPSALLLGVLEACLRSRHEGCVAVGLSHPVLDGDHLAAGLDTVDADHPHVRSDLAPVISWHEVTLEPGPDGGWTGRIVAR